MATEKVYVNGTIFWSQSEDNLNALYKSSMEIIFQFLGFTLSEAVQKTISLNDHTYSLFQIGEISPGNGGELCKVDLYCTFVLLFCLLLFYFILLVVFVYYYSCPNREIVISLAPFVFLELWTCAEYHLWNRRCCRLNPIRWFWNCVSNVFLEHFATPLRFTKAHKVIPWTQFSLLYTSPFTSPSFHPQMLGAP